MSQVVGSCPDVFRCELNLCYFSLISMVLCENSVFEEKKRNLIELDIIKTRVDGAIGIKLFLTFFHPQIEASALGFARI